MNDFTPWSLFVDIGIISALLLFGKLLRVKVKLLQKLFIPPCLVAGFLALAFGPNGLDWLPLSNQTGTYAGILIAFIFSCLPFTSQKQKHDGGAIGVMWSYSQAGMLFQWALGGLLGVLVLSHFWPVTEGIGVSMPAGFCGGHGSAAALGQAFSQFGHDEILTLAMTAATVGIVAAVILGLVIVKWATKRGHTAFIASYDELPEELRTGLLSAEKRESMGQSTMSSISIDSLTFNIAVIAVIAAGGYGLSRLVTTFLPGLELPVFSCAFVVGIIVKKVFDRTRVNESLCGSTVSHLSGAFTDYLVAFGIASIKLSVVLEYIYPLLVLLIAGLVVTFLYVFVMGRRMLKDYWFEKAIFTWGWYTGTMAMGIALLRVVDPDMRSRSLDTYALAYLFIAPVEIALITFAPMAFLNGYGLSFSLLCLAGAIVALGLAYFKGWTKHHQQVES